MKKKILTAILLSTFLFSNAEANPISIRLTDGEVRTLLTSLARIGGINILLDDSVTGKISVSLENIEPLDAIEMVARTKNLNIDREDEFLIVTSKDKAMISTEIFPIKFGDPDELRSAIIASLDSKRSSISKNVVDNFSTNKLVVDSSKNSVTVYGDRNSASDRVVIDRASNSILIRGTRSEIETARKILETIDIPAKQISIEARVISFNKDASKELGVEWQWSAIPQYPDVDLDWISRRIGVTNADGSESSVRVDIPVYEYNRKLGDNMSGILQFGRGPEGIPFEWYYGAKINAMISDGKANILSRPNISTIQGREAIINIGGKVPVPTVSTTNSTTTTSIEYRDAGIILKCTPRVNDDGSITSQIHVEVSTPIYVESLKAYRFQNRSADTMLRVENGGTMVIGGLMSKEESKAISKVPFLGDIPILGNLFKNRKRSKSDQELTIFLTAKILE